MSHDASESLELLRKIHTLLELLAEDKIAQRDARQRETLRQIAGDGTQKQNSILLMDGSRSQADICKSTSINKGNLSRLVGLLLKSNLLTADTKQPKIIISIPTNFFERNVNSESD